MIYLFTLLGSLILYFEKFGLIYLCSEKHKFRNIISSELLVFTTWGAGGIIS